MRRIAIVGISGSGKTSVARRLRAVTGLPLYHMDQLFWRGAWEAVPEQEYLDAHAYLIEAHDWIIEGFIDPTMASRARAADLVVYLDISPLRCALNVVIRWLKHRRVAREELPAAALERLSLSFLQVVVSGAEAPGIEAALRLAPDARVLRLHTRAATRILERLLAPETSADMGLRKTWGGGA
jgi:hypothetical protein